MHGYAHIWVRINAILTIRWDDLSSQVEGKYKDENSLAGKDREGSEGAVPCKAVEARNEGVNGQWLATSSSQGRQRGF